MGKEALQVRTLVKSSFIGGKWNRSAMEDSKTCREAVLLNKSKTIVDETEYRMAA